MTVRRAVPADVPILRAVRLEALGDSPGAFASSHAREAARTPADWRRWLSPGVVFLLEEAGVARGLVSGVPDAGDPGIVHLMAMWVHPALRGSGAADALVTEHLAWARSTGARLVRLGVMQANERARRVYQRHGFRLTGRQVVREDGRVEREMELALGPTTARVLAPPPVIFLGALAAGLALQAWRPLPLFGHRPAARIAGAGLIVTGLALSGAVMRQFGKAGTPVTPWRETRRLVVSGPYRFSRNPDYVGQALLTVGMGLLLRVPWALVTLAPALLLVRYGVIAREERYLERRFGEEYRRFRARVRRWL